MANNRMCMARLITPAANFLATSSFLFLSCFTFLFVPANFHFPTPHYSLPLIKSNALVAHLSGPSTFSTTALSLINYFPFSCAYVWLLYCVALLAGWLAGWLWEVDAWLPCWLYPWNGQNQHGERRQKSKMVAANYPEISLLWLELNHPDSIQPLQVQMVIQICCCCNFCFTFATTTTTTKQVSQRDLKSRLLF